jgi:hypothetical protein
MIALPIIARNIGLNDKVKQVRNPRTWNRNRLLDITQEREHQDKNAAWRELGRRDKLK